MANADAKYHKNNITKYCGTNLTLENDEKSSILDNWIQLLKADEWYHDFLFSLLLCRLQPLPQLPFPSVHSTESHYIVAQKFQRAAAEKVREENKRHPERRKYHRTRKVSETQTPVRYGSTHFCHHWGILGCHDQQMHGYDFVFFLLFNCYRILRLE